MDGATVAGEHLCLELRDHAAGDLRRLRPVHIQLGQTDAQDLAVGHGQLDLQVADLEAAIRAAESAVTAVGGYVAGSQRSGDADQASASVMFRIPAARWTDTLDALRKLGTKILGEQTSSQEVTAQVVDLGARLANLRVTETALQAIMEKAIKIPDVLAVQEQLTGVRQQIEELTAQKLTLENQAALATLTVNFTPPPAVAVNQVREGWDPAREVDQAAAALVGLGQGLAGAGIWLLIVWLPILLVAGLLALRTRRGPAGPSRRNSSDGSAARRGGVTAGSQGSRRRKIGPSAGPMGIRSTDGIAGTHARFAGQTPVPPGDPCSRTRIP